MSSSRQRNCWLWLILFLIIPFFSVAQGFYIKNYRVDITINDDASFTVEEVIDVFFTERRRGIFRTIPYEKEVDYNFQGQKALRSSYGDRYQIMIRDLDVEGYRYTSYTESGNLVIRIGDPDVYLSGDQRYRIRYKVYGAINEFPEHAEFSWNVIGDAWPVEIQHVQFSINLPGQMRPGDRDYLVFTGYRGSKSTNATMQSSPGNVSGKTNQALRPGQGVTVALRMPKRAFKTFDIPIQFLTKQYFVESIKTTLNLREDGGLEVREDIRFVIPERATTFKRIVALRSGEDASGQTFYPFVDDLYVSVEGMQDGQYNVSLYGSGVNPVIEIQPGGGFAEITEVQLAYTVWGAVSYLTDGRYALNWNIFSCDHPEPIESASVAFSMGQEGQLRSGPRLPGPSEVQKELYRINKSARSFEIVSNKRMTAGMSADLTASFDSRTVNLAAMPQAVFAKQYWITTFDKQITVRADGKVDVKELYFPRFRYDDSPEYFRTIVQTGETESYAHPMFFSGWNLLGRKERYQVALEKTNGLQPIDKRTYPNWAFGIPAENQADPPRQISLDYSTKGSVIRNKLEIPLWIPQDEPFLSGNIRVDFEESIDPSALKVMLINEEGLLIDEVPVENAQIEIHLPGDTYAHQPVYLQMLMPDAATGKSNVLNNLLLYWKNNIPLIGSIILGFLLYVLWMFVGKDSPGTIIARFRPPEGMTPSEAGFIYDGKLHGKDLIALIYYWAALGYLKIRELESKKRKQDFEFVKLKDLPGTARKYERTLFQGLFRGRDKVKLSDLKYSFYPDYNQSRKEFARFERKAGYYVSGTRGLGRFLQFLGLLALVAGMVMTVVGSFIQDFQYAIPLFISAVLLWIFGRIMPRMGKSAQQDLDHLLGFREFIRAAESERLKTLIDDDPKYFGLTLPFAIVMGEGERWGKKFDSILTEPPDWYEGYDRRNFHTTIFVASMMDNMHVMRGSFAAMPASSGGGGGSSWSGGSMFGGGGFSGGGFGGGGGGSW